MSTQQPIKITFPNPPDDYRWKSLADSIVAGNPGARRTLIPGGLPIRDETGRPIGTEAPRVEVTHPARLVIERRWLTNLTPPPLGKAKTLEEFRRLNELHKRQPMQWGAIPKMRDPETCFLTHFDSEKIELSADFDSNDPDEITLARWQETGTDLGRVITRNRALDRLAKMAAEAPRKRVARQSPALFAHPWAYRKNPNR